MTFYLSLTIIIVLIFLLYQVYNSAYSGDFSNSLWTESSLADKTVMIIVPHQDDEINLAGATIKNLTDNHIHVIVVFATTSDYHDSGIDRLHEALAASQILGVPEEDIVFLGYCNMPMVNETQHFYNADEDLIITSDQGLQETYALPEKPEFCFNTTNKHKKYTKKNLRTDIQEVIMYYKPEIIFAVDFDRHIDHRAISLIFEEAVSNILSKKNNSYFPEIYKGFCYNGSYLGKKDFYDLNLAGESKAEGEFINNPDFDTDFPPYLWQERLRLPVARTTLSRTLNNNLIYSALRAHFSQGIIHNAKRIINSDQIFWRRLTTSLSYQSHITVTSGNGQCLNDFKLADCNNIYELPASFSGTWIPSNNDIEKKAFFSFDTPQTIQQIILYGNSNLDSRVLEGTITLNNGFTTKFGPLKEGSKATIVDFISQHNISSLTISLDKLQGDQAGLNEVEIYSSDKPPSLLNFIKIMLNDTFAYEYLITEKIKSLPLNLYSHGKIGTCKIFPVNNDDFQLSDNEITFGRSFKTAIIRAEAENNKNIYDQIIIRKITTLQLLILKASQIINMILHRIEHIIKHKYQMWIKGYPYE